MNLETKGSVAWHLLRDVGRSGFRDSQSNQESQHRHTYIHTHRRKTDTSSETRYITLFLHKTWKKQFREFQDEKSNFDAWYELNDVCLKLGTEEFDLLYRIACVLKVYVLYYICFAGIVSGQFRLPMPTIVTRSENRLLHFLSIFLTFLTTVKK